MLKVLRHPDFLRLFISLFITEAGNQIYRIAIMSWTYNYTKSPILTAGVMVAQMTASVVIGPLLAPLADSYERRGLLVLSEASSALVVVLLPLFLMHSIWGILLAAFAVGSLERLGNPVIMAILPEIVDKDDLDAANSLLLLPQRTLEFVFLGLAGVLVATLGPQTAFWIDAVSFALSALVLLGLRRLPAHGEPQGGYWEQVLEGVRFLWDNPTARFVVGVLAPAASFGAVEMAVAVVLAKDVLAAGNATTGTIYYGLLDASMAVGALLGLFAVPLIMRNFPRKVVFLGSLALFGIFEALAGVSGWIVWAMLFFALSGIVNQLFIVPARVMLQESSAPETRARLFGAWGAAMSLAMLVGISLGGVLAELAGPSMAFVIAGAGVFAVAALAWLGGRS